MKVTRRSFLATAPAVVGTILVADKLSFAGTSAHTAGDGDPLGKLGWEAFLPYVGTTFSFRSEAGSDFAFRLDNMDDRRTAAQRLGSGECFSLIFSSSTRCPLKQGTYDVTHFAFGSFRLFVTVQDTVNRRRKYEAIVNRISA